MNGNDQFAEIVDEAGPILTAVTQQMFGPNECTKEKQPCA